MLRRPRVKPNRPLPSWFPAYYRDRHLYPTQGAPMTQPTRASRLATARSADIYLRPRGTQILAPATMASHNPLHKLVLTREMGRALWNPDSNFDIIWGDLTLTVDEARSIFERDGLIPARDPAPDPQPSDPSHPDRLQNALDRINANHKAALQALDSGPGPSPGPSHPDQIQNTMDRVNQLRQAAIRDLDESFEKLPDHIKLRCRACPEPKTPTNFGRSTQKADGDWFPLQGRLTLEQVEQLQDAAFRPERTSLGLIAVARKLEEWGVTVV